MEEEKEDINSLKRLAQEKDMTIKRLEKASIKNRKELMAIVDYFINNT